MPRLQRSATRKESLKWLTRFGLMLSRCGCGYVLPIVPHLT